MPGRSSRLLCARCRAWIDTAACLEYLQHKSKKAEWIQTQLKPVAAQTLAGAAYILPGGREAGAVSAQLKQVTLCFNGLSSD